MTILIQNWFRCAVFLLEYGFEQTEAESEYEQIKEKLTQADSFTGSPWRRAVIQRLWRREYGFWDADTSLAVMPESNETKALSSRISALRVDLEKQRNSAMILFSVFPDGAFCGSIFTSDTLSLGTFEGGRSHGHGLEFGLPQVDRHSESSIRKIQQLDVIFFPERKP